jgi:hypothetical protein
VSGNVELECFRNTGSGFVSILDAVETSVTIGGWCGLVFWRYASSSFDLYADNFAAGTL